METNPDTGRVDLELEAMRNVIQALSVLPDDQARARVLRWAGDRLALPQASVLGSAPEQGAARDGRSKPIEIIDTSDLNLEGLESLFEGEPQGDETAGAEAGAASSLRGEIRGFHRKARSRHSA